MADNVTNIKGAVDGGYAFSAPAGSSVPAIGSALGTAFKNMGYVSADGIAENRETEVEEVSDLSGNVVYTMKSRETEKLVLTLISLTEDSLKEMHGHDNVSTSGNVITVEHITTDYDQRVYVFDLLCKDGRQWRKKVPSGQVTEVGPIVYGAGNVFGREITITCYPDSDGVRMYDYIQVSPTGTTS